MSSARSIMRASRLAVRSTARPFSTTTARFAVPLNERGNDTADEYRRIMKSKPLNPHMTNTNSTIANEMPNVGEDAAPPELITSVDANFVPKDSKPENTERMTGGTQTPAPESGPNAGLDVGEIEGGTFKVEPLRRTGEDVNTMRARLVYQSRKRGTLESDLLLSTFADANLGTMTTKQLQQYDLFLDENDWDIYYWTTQEPTPTSMAYAEGAGPDMAAPEMQGKDVVDVGATATKSASADGTRVREPGTGEWAATIGTFKAAYRPVPARWKNSEILSMLRKHVKDRSAGGVQDHGQVDVSSQRKGGGLGFMPELKNFDQ
ncbi:hypothetical protein CBER1_05756 [Cercospora berteroae]|uniref:Succinate dehydrogenase assembly factor 2, mitochondrial n=1 Tax=Cercospora berteroae TaxID=357750 RepID=A0A2S6BT37_9PEZI|nr:hypothetical protein CBER1_05756 [Cercospora berteroae]